MTQTTEGISIIYQDHYLLIVNKPADLVIHPTYKNTEGTMWDTLLVYLRQQGEDDWQPPEFADEPEWIGAPEDIQVMLRERRTQRLWKEDGLLTRPCLLHRLDKNTSGVVALARTERSRRHIVRQFLEHTIVKRYLVVVRKGAPYWAEPRTTFTVTRRREGEKETLVRLPLELESLYEHELVLDGPLQRDPDDRRRCIVGPDGQAATTIVRVLAVEESFILLEVRLVTGRTHQIRAHLAALGYAIVGDQTYALAAEVGTPQAALKRQFLHAYSLELRRYPDNLACSFVAPLADELIWWMGRYFRAGLGALDYVGNSIPG